jgi:O-methyltransferase
MTVRNLLHRYFGSPHDRRRAWSKHLARVAQRYGLVIYPHHLTWSLPGELTELAARWGDLPGLPLDCCQLLYAVARNVRARGVPGATAECGVRYGKSSFFILNGLADPGRPHHLCDSFEGLSEPVAADAETGARRDAWRAGDLIADEQIARNQLKDFPQCRFHRGWIPDCFAGLEHDRFALVHIDVDLYEPTRAAFEFFHPRMSPGGVMICDDYGFASCPGARKAVDEYFSGRRDAPIELPSGQALVFHAG